MQRKTARENTFILLFEDACKSDECAEEIFLKATESKVMAEVLKRRGMKCKAVLKTDQAEILKSSREKRFPLGLETFS